MTSGRWIKRAKIAAFPLLALLVFSVPLIAADGDVPSSVDVYWQSTRTIAAPGVSTVVVLDDEIAHAESHGDAIEFAGISRGDTVVLAYLNGAPVSILVHVIERPVQFAQPSLRHNAEMAHGMIASDLQMTNAGDSTPFTVLNSFAWAQQVGDHALDFNTQVEDDSQFGGHSFNLRNGGLSYRTPNVGVYVLDFTQSLTGASGEDHINNFSSPSSVQLRGGALTVRSGNNDFSFFGGSTIPYYFLALNATRDVAGFAFHRKQTNKLSFYGGASYLNIPLNLTSGIQRREYFMQNAGVAYRITRGFLIGAESGVSNDGKMGRVDASYSSYRFSGYGTAIYSSQTFPLNQLQSLFSGTSSYKGGASYRMTSRWTQSVYAEHTDIVPGLIYRVAGSTDYLSPNASYRISSNQTANFAYTHSRNTGGFTATTATGNRYDVSLNSQFGQHVANNAQVTVGSVQDPLQISSQDELTIRDSVTLPIKGQTILLGVEHDRVQPSLTAKLNQEINLLSPALQAEFLANPAGFVDSSNFPPEVKALLQAEQPIGTTFSALSNLNIGSRLRFTPSLSVTHAANGPNATAWTQSAGYSLAFQITPSWQFRSSLNNVLLWNTVQHAAQRTTVITAGFQKTFTTAPGSLSLLHRTRIIEGRVFRDNNINGSFNVGEPGVAGVQVQLDDSEVTLTDEQGRYRFSGVSADEHRVSVDTKQFREPIRMTTNSEIEADLIQQHLFVINFGILDFSRVMGNVYNDLRFDNSRQPDSKGVQDIQLLLENGKQVRKIATTGSGDFELDDVPPGDYKLSLDPMSIPPNYVIPIDSVTVHVGPVSTVVKDIPVRALRSISGTVFLKTAVPNESIAPMKSKQTEKQAKAANNPVPVSAPSEEFKLLPVSGVQIAAGSITATTDAEGKFLLRNLPAGQLKVTLAPVKAVPAGMNIPSGAINLPPEPVQVQGATIVITNAELLPYVSREFHNGTETGAAQSVTHIGVPPIRTKPVTHHVTAANPALPTTTEPPVSSTQQPAVQIEPRTTKTEASAVSRAITPSAPAVQPGARTDVSAAPPVSLLPRKDDGAAPTAAPDGVLTREVCNQLPSLGEIAQCLRQLKLNSSTNPK